MKQVWSWYECMLQIRQFELLLEDYNAKGKIYGTSHLYIGQEAVAVGIISQLQPSDLVLSTHRNHGHAIAKGLDTKALFAEVFGKAAGSNGGRAGSMLISDLSKGFVGGNGIVGGNFPLALGLAQAVKMDQSQQVVVCFSGEGAVNEGTFLESLNLARIWNLPIAFVIENNRYAMSSLSHQMTAGSIKSRTQALDIPYFQADGQDVFAVASVFQKVQKALRTGPALLEVQTYRFRGHSRSDQKENYRTGGEKQQIVDPVVLLEEYLKEQGISEQVLQDMRFQVEQRLKEEAQKSLRSPDAGEK